MLRWALAIGTTAQPALKHRPRACLLRCSTVPWCDPPHARARAQGAANRTEQNRKRSSLRAWPGGEAVRGPLPDRENFPDTAPRDTAPRHTRTEPAATWQGATEAPVAPVAPHTGGNRPLPPDDRNAQLAALFGQMAPWAHRPPKPCRRPQWRAVQPCSPCRLTTCVQAQSGAPGKQQRQAAQPTGSMQRRSGLRASCDRHSRVRLSSSNESPHRCRQMGDSVTALAVRATTSAEAERVDVKIVSDRPRGKRR